MDSGRLVEKSTGKPAEMLGFDFSKPWRGYVASDYEGYQCPVTDKWIEGRYAHKENLKRTGCRLLEPGESRDAPKRMADERNASMDRILGE